MAVGTALLKTALLAGLVAVYWRPLDVAVAVGAPPPEGGFQQAHAHVVRFLLTVVSYSWALSVSSSWFVVVLALITLQTICWASFISEQRVLSNALGDYLDEQTEKEVFQSGAVVLFGLLVAIILFGGRAGAKAQHRRRLVAFYTKNNPDKIADVDKILKKYEGKEDLLFARLHRKYSRVLSHTPAEDAVDDLDHDGGDEDEVSPEGAFIEEVEYIQATSSPTSASSTYSKTVVTTTTTTTSTTSNGFEDVEEEEDEANLPMIQPRAKSPASSTPAGKAPSVPPSPAVAKSASGSAAGSAASSPPRSPRSNSSNTVRKASEEARRALQERVQQRVAQLQSRSSSKKKQ